MQETDTEIDAVEVIDQGELDTVEEKTIVRFPTRKQSQTSSGSYATYILLPAVFLTVTLLGGLRLGAVDNAFLFLKPALICLVFAALTVVLFARSGMIAIEGWISEDRPMLENAGNIAVLLTLFTATVQLYNSLLPEQGLTFWVIGFCFFWTIWNNLFADFDPKRLLRSMIALFGLAFVVKYLVLANITAAPTGSWWQRLFENPGKEAFTWLLELPQYSARTGYIQFFALSFYLIGLYLLPRQPRQ